MKILEASLNDVSLIAPLFDAYRVFYQAKPDPQGAVSFLSERLIRGESIIFFAYQEGFAGRGQGGQGPVGRIAVGFTQLYPSFSSVSMQRLWILNDLYVDPAYRKSGVGSALMERAREFALQDGAKGLSLATQNENLTAQALYAKMGYAKDTEFFHFHLVFPRAPK
jgi:GNAT superfamily N-acetyltransferase